MHAFFSTMESKLSDKAICCVCRESVDGAAQDCPHCKSSPMLDGRYLLREVLGSTGERSTYRATRIEDNVDVAIKVLEFRRINSFKTEELFRREIEVLRQIRHPSIPQIVDSFAAGDGKLRGLYAVRELVEGRSLQEEMSERHYSPREVAAIAAELLDILAFIHGLTPPLIHRDLTPSNVLRRSDGRLMLIDFGAVKESVGTQGSTVSGTYGYMAPEQFRGVASKASDIYGVGALALALLTGQPADELVDERHRLVVASYVPRGALRVLLKDMLCIDQARRPRDAGTLAQELRRISRGDPPRGRERLSPRAWIGGLTLAVLLVGSTPATPHQEDPRPDRAEPQVATNLERSTQPEPFSRSWPRRIDVPPSPPDLRRPAPPPSPDWSPECEAQGTCLDVSDEFAALTLENVCAPLVVRETQVERTLQSPSPLPLALGEREFSCDVSIQLNRFCNVLCRSSGEGEQDADLNLVKWIGDRYGAFTKSFSQPYVRTYAFEQLDEGAYGRRTWTWNGDDRDLVVIAQKYPGAPEQLTLSYRGLLGATQAKGGAEERSGRAL